MIAVFDVGNSEITIGIFGGEELISHWRVTTAAPRTADELAILIRSITGDVIASPGGITGSAICSVVPAITPMLAEACEMCFGRKPVMIDARAKLPVKLDVEEPFTVGADRIANTLAASRIYKRDAIVVDLGTATTYDCITADGTFLGGVIQPGVMISADTLFRRTAQLPATDIVPP
jgi:type III pantothenate kinase